MAFPASFIHTRLLGRAFSMAMSFNKSKNIILPADHVVPAIDSMPVVPANW